MTDHQKTCLESLASYAHDVTVVENRIDDGSSDQTDHQARLDVASKDLSQKVEREQSIVREIRTADALSYHPSVDPVLRLYQLKVIKHAYTTLSSSAPELPPPASPVPALLTLRCVLQAVPESRKVLVESSRGLENAQERLRGEESRLSAAKLLSNALDDRTKRLRAELADVSSLSPEEAARRHIARNEKCSESLDAEVTIMTKDLVNFINDHLASMLAVEELGGPVVGDLLDIADETIAASFASRGSIKRTGSNAGPVTSRVNVDEETDNADQGPRLRRTAAIEVRSLVEALLNTAIDEGPDAYVKVRRESAAARYLVKSRVAMLHPKNPLQIRLINFAD